MVVHWCLCGVVMAVVSVFVVQWYSGVCVVHWCVWYSGVCVVQWCVCGTVVCAAKPGILEIQIMFSARLLPVQPALPPFLDQTA